MSASTCSDLAEELGRLRQSAPQIAEQLESAVRIMRASGVPPTAELLRDLQDYRTGVCRLAAALATDETSSLDQLQQRLEVRRRCESAEELRGRLSQLTYVGDPDFQPLAKCIQLAAQLCEQSQGPAGEDESREFELLLQGRHPLHSIVRWATHGDELTDAEWSECCETVTSAFGPQLATALTRGRIRPVGSDTAGPASGDGANAIACPAKASDDSFTRQAEAIISNAQALTELVQFQSLPAPTPFNGFGDRNPPSPAPASSEPDFQQHQSFDVLSTEEGASPPGAESSSIFGSTMEPQTTVGRSSSPLKRRAAPETMPVGDRSRTDEANASLQDSTSIFSALDSEASGGNPSCPPAEGAGTRAARLSHHIIRLMAEDRLPLAQQLVQCLETRPEPSIEMPPSWLLRAVLLGRHISYTRGPATRQLEEELRNFRPGMLTEGNLEQQLVNGFLLRAAAVPAALLAGSAAATNILRTFEIDPELCQLYNYCSRIATYGSRLAGALVETFRPAGTIAGASELQEVARSARDWLQNTAKKWMSYGRSSPLFLHAHWTVTPGTAMQHAETCRLWCKWQQTLLAAKRLLAPVCQGLDGERNWVRKEIARLTSQLQASEQQLRQKTGPRTTSNESDLLFPIPEIHATLHEAINLAKGWLQLCDQAGPGGASPIPPEALEVRTEILHRSPAVIDELIQHRRNATSALSKAAIACCQASVRYIESVFESKTALPAAELDPRKVFNADLLRFPGLELNDQWQPENDPETFEFELLSRLEHGELSWRQSYDVHAQAGQHVATGRLLELDVWENATDFESLMTLRNAQIMEARSILRADLDALASDLNRAAQTAGWSPALVAVNQQRLDVLHNELPHVLNFGAFRRQLEQLKSMTTRWKQSRSSPPGVEPKSTSPAANVRSGQMQDRSSVSKKPASASCWDALPEESEGLFLTYDGQVPPQLPHSSADIYSGD